MHQRLRSGFSRDSKRQACPLFFIYVIDKKVEILDNAGGGLMAKTWLRILTIFSSEIVQAAFFKRWTASQKQLNQNR